MSDTRDDCLRKLRAWVLEGGRGGFIPARRTVELYLGSQALPHQEARAIRRDLSNWNPFKTGSQARLINHLLAYLQCRSEEADRDR